jgi:hypothetical protein
MLLVGDQTAALICLRVGLRNEFCPPQRRNSAEVSYWEAQEAMAQTIASFLRHVTAFIFEDNPAPYGDIHSGDFFFKKTVSPSSVLYNSYWVNVTFLYYFHIFDSYRYELSPS